MGIIVRTAAAGVSLEELQWDLDYLLSISDREWEDVVKKSPLKMEYDPGNKRLKELVKNKINA